MEKFSSENVSGNAQEKQEKREQLEGLLEYIWSAYDEQDTGRVNMVVEQIITDLDTFSPLSHRDIADMFMESGLSWVLATYIQHFAIDHEAMAIEIIRAGEDSLVPDYIQNFKCNHATVAKELITAGEGARVMEYIHNFGEEYHNEIAGYFIAAGEVDLLKEHIGSFKNVSDAVMREVRGGVISIPYCVCIAGVSVINEQVPWSHLSDLSRRPMRYECGLYG